MWMSLWSCNKVFEVVHLPDKFIVDLDKWYCSCGKWRVSGLPCQHSISCMHYLNIEVYLYVLDCFKKSIYSECYQHSVFPTNGPNFWPKLKKFVILPPIRRRAPGRPKKKRNIDANEEKSKTKVSCKRDTVTCTKCGIIRHNREVVVIQRHEEKDGILKQGYPEEKLYFILDYCILKISLLNVLF